MSLQGRNRADLGQGRRIMVRSWARACEAEPGSMQDRSRTSPWHGMARRARPEYCMGHGMTGWSIGQCQTDSFLKKYDNIVAKH